MEKCLKEKIVKKFVILGFSVGDLDIDQAEMDFSLPQEFIDEWKRLKGYEI